MNISVNVWLREIAKLLRQPHFWFIAVTICVLSSLYYGYEYDRHIVESWLPWFWHIVVFEFTHDMNGILFYVPFIYAGLTFWWRGALIVWLFSMIIMLPHVITFSANNISLVSNVFYLLLPLILPTFISLEFRWRERERKTMADREAERRNYMAQIFKAQEDERSHIARELHDDTTQNLLVIANKTQTLLSDFHDELPPKVKEHMESIRDEVLEISSDVRRISRNLRPSILDNMGLLPALRWLVDSLNRENGINTHMSVNGQSRKLSPEADVNIFRFVQEALNNVRRHSKATEAFLELEFNNQDMKVTVRDNGIGFNLPQSIERFSNKGKLGLIGLKERANFLGGIFNIQSRVGEGTSVSIEFISSL